VEVVGTLDEASRLIHVQGDESSGIVLGWQAKRDASWNASCLVTALARSTRSLRRLAIAAPSAHTHSDLNLVKFAILSLHRWSITEQILITQFNPDFFGDTGKVVGIIYRERSASGQM